MDAFHFEPVTIGGVTFRNPLYVASGPTTRNLRQLQKAEACGWGGASIKLVIDPAPYINREPRYGWFSHPGIFAFTAEKRLTPDEGLQLVESARTATTDLVVLANITYAGEETVENGWVRLAKRFEAAGAHVIELNMCCPNMSFNVELTGSGHREGPKTGASLGQDADAVGYITRAVKQAVSIPVFVKLTPEGGRIARVAQACIDAGADAVGGTANRLAIPPFDIQNPDAAPYHLQDELSMSCFSGAWIKPLALRDVYEMRKLMGPEPVITGAGGIRNWQDVVAMAYMGAQLFGICTETILSGYGFLGSLIDELRQFLEESGYGSLEALRGSLVDRVKSAEEITLHPGHAEVVDSGLSAPCVAACPQAVPAQGYVQAVANGNFRRAFDLVTSAGPFQSMCGYVCHHPCEAVCLRGELDDPIRIREIKRFILEYGRRREWKPRLRPAESKSAAVAVVGGGPAGLTAAYYLALAGYRVTVFERHREAGGMLRTAIPRFRLPQDVLQAEIDAIAELGVQIETGRRFPGDVSLARLQQGFQAVVMAVGVQAGVPMPLDGTSAAGCCDALAFLKAVAAGERPVVGERVAIIGGGFTALDAARTCRRLGASEVFLLYRRTREEMPAIPEDVEEAEAEGVQIMYQVAPVALLAEKGRVTGVRMVHQVLGDRDASERRSPVAVEGTEFTLRVETVISAIGQTLDFDPARAGLPGTTAGRIAAESATMHTSLPGVFAAGDAVLGAGNLITAVASGRRAAVAVDRYLAGDGAVLQELPALHTVDPGSIMQQKGAVPRSAGVTPAPLAAADRVAHFDLCTRTLTEKEAVAEAQRCLNCGCGEGCLQCVEICNSFAIQALNGRPWIDADECVGCGVCVWRCPNKNIHMRRTNVEDVPAV